MKQRIKKQFWLSLEDNAELKRKAELSGLSETSVIRLLIRGFEPREKPDARFYDTMSELSAIGNNINQLAVKANALGFVDMPMLNRSNALAQISGGHGSDISPSRSEQSEMAIRRRTE